MFKVLTLLKLMFSDDIGGRLKALASTKLKVETANRQSSNRVRVVHSWWVGMQAKTSLVIYQKILSIELIHLLQYNLGNI